MSASSIYEVLADERTKKATTSNDAILNEIKKLDLGL